MYIKQATVNNQVGLHARPATFFIQKANEFKSTIWVEKDEQRVNAKSLLGVLSLGIIKGSTIDLIADGTDEKDGCRRPGANCISSDFCRLSLERKGFCPGDNSLAEQAPQFAAAFFTPKADGGGEARPLRN